MIVVIVVVGGLAGTAWATGSRPAQPRLLSGPLQTGVMSLDGYTKAEGDALFDRIHSTGASIVRLPLVWRAVAPVTRPSGFDPANPDDSAYDWSRVDSQVGLAIRHGLVPMLDVVQAPQWAEGAPDPKNYVGATEIDAAQLGLFARAAASRYDGRNGRPRVSAWMVWNEPNSTLYIYPQTNSAGALVGVAKYRAMVNAVAASVHSVRDDNLVVAGGQTPFTRSTSYLSVISPMKFMRALLCESDGAQPTATCNEKIEFDVWSHHPFTSGGPRHHAYLPADVSIADLPEMRAVLQAAVAQGHVTARHNVRFWATEFSWDTQPPDTGKAVPMALAQRWVPEGFYRMWKAGVSAVIWTQLRDDPFPGGDIQGGLWFRGAGGLATDKPKPILKGFRFPFVAFATSAGSSFWGRVPPNAMRGVSIQARGPSGYRRIASVRADAYGIVRGTLARRLTGSTLRAVAGKVSSNDYRIGPTPDRAVNPFG